MAEHSYSDLNGMRDDAIRRVREMQKQAMAVTEAERRNDNPKPEKKKMEPKTDFTEHKTIPNQGPTHNQLGEILKNNELSEEMLLLAIAALLLSDNCDTILVLAIMYILSN